MVLAGFLGGRPRFFLGNLAIGEGCASSCVSIGAVGVVSHSLSTAVSENESKIEDILATGIKNKSGERRVKLHAQLWLTWSPS
jgi:hypothetical protein